MVIQDIASILGVSKRTIEMRLKKLTTEQKDSIRVSIKKGNTRQYMYNDKALLILQSDSVLHSATNNTTISMEKHLQELLDNANTEILELKEIIKELKLEKQQGNIHQQDIQIAYSESTKYIQTLLENQQKITMDLQQKLELPAKKKKGILKRLFNNEE